jgi:hypothetical protein
MHEHMYEHMYEHTYEHLDTSTHIHIYMHVHITNTFLYLVCYDPVSDDWGGSNPGKCYHIRHCPYSLPVRKAFIVISELAHVTLSTCLCTRRTYCSSRDVYVYIYTQACIAPHCPPYTRTSRIQYTRTHIQERAITLTLFRALSSKYNPMCTQTRTQEHANEDQ